MMARRWKVPGGLVQQFLELEKKQSMKKKKKD